MPIHPLTPQEQLALSRKAILRHMNRHNRDYELDLGNEAAVSGGSEPLNSGRMSTLKQAVRIWWFRHPASSVVELARPLLTDYARAHPFKLLGLSAGLGATAVLVRPWRVVSVGGLLVAAVKSSGLSGILLSLLTNPSQSNQDTP